jgi:parvulin-like peptidyl-prolyl isomerase
MMWAWLDRNAQPLQAIAAIITVLAALIAVIVVPIQINAADRIQREQTAREIYREFLNLTANKPEIAAADYCALKEDKDKMAYEAYVEYLLYTAEQMIDTDDTWRAPMTSYMTDHMDYFCSANDFESQTPAVSAIIEGLRKNCKADAACPAQ